MREREREREIIKSVESIKSKGTKEKSQNQELAHNYNLSN